MSILDDGPDWRSLYAKADRMLLGAAWGFAAYYVACMIFVFTLLGIMGGGGECDPPPGCPHSPGVYVSMLSALVALTAGMPAGVWAIVPRWRVHLRPALAAAGLTLAVSAVLELAGAWGPDAGFLALILMGPAQIVAALVAWRIRASRR